MQPFQICIGPIIRIGRESWCLPYAGIFNKFSIYVVGEHSVKILSFWLHGSI